jgi:hypothetical protein
MILFVGELLIAPFDPHEIWLKSYPCRLGAVLLPFITMLCGYFVPQR